MGMSVIVDCAMLINHIHHTPIGEERYRQPGRLLEGALAIGEGGQCSARRGEKRQSFFCATALGDGYAKLLALFRCLLDGMLSVAFGRMEFLTQPAGRDRNCCEYSQP